MILQAIQRRLIELGVAKDSAVGGNEGHAMGERGSGGVGEGIGVESLAPLCADQSCLAQEFNHAFFAQAVAKAPIDTGHRQDNEDPTNQ